MKLGEGKDERLGKDRPSGGKSPRQYDLTRGSILSKILLVAVPVMGTQLLQMSYNLTDMFWLGRMENAAATVAASGTAGLFMWLSMAPMMFGRMGAEIGVSQNIGRGNRDEARLYGQNAVLSGLILGTLYGLIMVLFHPQMVGFFRLESPDIIRQAENYLAIVGFGIPFAFATSAMTGMFNGSGNSRAPFLSNCVGLGLNIVLDPLMIFVMGLGIRGAAFATVIAQVTSFSVLFAFAMAGKSRPFERFALFSRLRGYILRQILKWSLPIVAESAFFCVMSMLTTRMLSPFGETPLAVGRVGSQIESMSWLIGGGFGSALTSYIGQNYGAGKWTRIRKGFKISALAMAAYGVLVMLMMYFFGKQLYWLFLPDEAVMAMGETYLVILLFCQVPQCMESVAASTFRGTGRTLPGSLCSVLSNVCRVAFAWILVRRFEQYGVWAAVSATAVMRGVSVFTWFLIAQRKFPRADDPEKRDSPDAAAYTDGAVAAPPPPIEPEPV